MTRGRHPRRRDSDPSSPEVRTASSTPARPGMAAALCALLVIITLAAFWKVRSNGFVDYDDPDYVVGNEQVQKGLNGDSIGWAFTSTQVFNWHPVTWLSHMADVQWFGLDAGRHHLTSLLLHCANAVLLLLLLFRMTGALWRSAFVAALFALHPLHVESVAWIAERKDVLSTLFWLLTLFAWLAYVRSKKTGPYLLASALFALGLMTKPMLVNLPFTLLLLDFWPLGRLGLPLRGRWPEVKRLLWEKAPLFALAAASSVVTYMVQRDQGVVTSLKALDFGSRLANAAAAYGTYLGRTVWPSSLVVFYPHPHSGLLTVAACGAALLLAGGTALALRLARPAPYLAFGWFWYLGTLVPVIGLVQVGMQSTADRYTYVPLIGIFVSVAWGLAALAGRFPGFRIAAPGVAAVVLAALFAVTRSQTAFWADTPALFGRALAVTSDNYVAHFGLGFHLYNHGRKEEAIAHLREAVRIRPEYLEARTRLGNALAGQGLNDEAVEHYRWAVRIAPESAKAWNNLGAGLAELNRLPEAIECFRRALEIDPGLVEVRDNLEAASKLSGAASAPSPPVRKPASDAPDPARALNEEGLAFGRMNRLPEAIGSFEKALRLDPGSIDVRFNLGTVLLQARRLPEALAQFDSALRLEPGSARVLNALGLTLGMMNRFPESIARLEEAVRVKPDFAEARINLGVSLDNAGRAADAIEQFREALRIEPENARAHAVLQDAERSLRTGRSPR